MRSLNNHHFTKMPYNKIHHRISIIEGTFFLLPNKSLNWIEVFLDEFGEVLLMP